MTFTVNDDLDKLIWDKHNKFHFFGSMVFAIIVTAWLFTMFVRFTDPWLAGILAWWFGYSGVYNIGVHWEIGDGFKRWWTKCEGLPWWKRQFLCSNGFSLQDLLVWDLGGSLIGSMVGIMFAILLFVLR